MQDTFASASDVLCAGALTAALNIARLRASFAAVVHDRSALRRSALARVTVEDCLERVNNRFALVILAAERARQLANGGRPLVQCHNKPAVTSLREIATGQVHFNESVEGTVRQYLDEIKARGARGEVRKP